MMFVLTQCKRLVAFAVSTRFVTTGCGAPVVFGDFRARQSSHPHVQAIAMAISHPMAAPLAEERSFPMRRVKHCGPLALKSKKWRTFHQSYAIVTACSPLDIGISAG